jgi:hypothetical protein
MIKDLLHTFPEALEERINGLLDTAEPSSVKCYQLYKTCQNENLWQDSFEKFSARMESYFSIPRRQRRKSDLDILLDQPLHSTLFGDFHLNFRNAVVSDAALMDIASWAHHLLRVGYKSNALVISLDVITKTLRYLTNPPLFEKDQDIRFEDFCEAWKKIVFKIFGKSQEAELQHFIKELHWIRTQSQVAENRDVFVPSIFLTQTEIDWTKDVFQSVSHNLAAPKFPLSRGPQKQRLKDLERTLGLYKIVQTTRLPELIKQRDNIRTTILYMCDRLLNECAK